MSAQGKGKQSRIRWTAEEKAALITQCGALRSQGWNKSVKELIENAQAVLPAARRRTIYPSLVSWMNKELAAAGVPAPADLQIGIMVEIPSAAVMADQLAPTVDFFSIGTNDLTQYTLAAERGNPRVAYLADALHPAVLRLIAQVIKAAHACGRWVGVCGELAGDLTAIPILLGLGLDEFSMSPAVIPAAKQRLRALNRQAATALAQSVLTLDSAQAVRAAVRAAEAERAGA